jgi:Dolichyl-phosphate-mannose-protein mannosyltransferase
VSKLRDRWPLFLLIALLLPMCFIGLRDTHDWGDDFAQYLAQARDLSEGHLISATDQVSNFENYGPAPKGLGFSLLLAPLWAASGNTVLPYLVLMSMVTLLLCIALYEFLRRDFGWLAAMLSALLFAYDRHVLHAKSEIMPDLLLTLLVLLCLLVLRRNDARRWWLLPVLVGFAILVKSAGWVLYVAALTNALVTWRKRSPEAPVNIKHVAATLLIPLAMALLVPFVLSRSFGSSTVWYASVFFDGSLLRTIGSNAIAYAGAFEHFFEQELPMWMNHALVLVLLVMIVLGAVVRLRRRADAGDGFTQLWLLMLLCYPYANSPDRYL